MLYNFVDTIDTKPQAGVDLPAEAMCYDGVFIENEIKGYRTLSVSGRELLGSEVLETEVDGMDGTIYNSKRLKPRTITVKYLLQADSNYDYRQAYNKLNSLLNKEQVQIIFNDELDKYFIGTKLSNTEVDAGSNCVIGEIEIYCSDPRKYSTALKEFTTSSGSLTVKNEGTLPATVDYQINCTAETGYVGIVSTEGIMQYGKIEELDTETYEQNEQLASLDSFFNCKDDTNGTDVMHPQYGANGALFAHTWFNNRFLGFGSTGNKKGSANGGLRTLVLPADSNGDTSGSKNFYCYFHLLFYAGLMGQTGEMCINFLTADNKLICGCNWYKTDAVGNTGHYEIWANGKVLRNWSYTTSHLHTQNPWYWDWGHCDILKEGANIRFFYWGGYYNYTIPEIADMKCAKIQVAVKQWGNRVGNQFMTFAGFNVINFYKQHVSKWRDVPNRYPAGTVINIDGETSHIYVNGMDRPGDEVVGTQYFKVPPGKTDIKFHVSDFCRKQPDVTVRIREAWL